MKFLKILLFFILTQALFAEKLEVTSSSFKVGNQEIHFIGNAKIQINDSWLHAERVIVYFDENNETERYEAIGLVTFEFKNKKHSFKGRANKVTYNMLSSRYVLKGKASIDSHFFINPHISGDEIILNLFTGRVDVKGGSIPTKFFMKAYDFSRIFKF